MPLYYYYDIISLDYKSNQIIFRSYGNNVRFVFTSSFFFCGRAYVIFTLFVHSDVQQILRSVFALFFVLCIIYCQCLWIADFWMPPFSLTFIQNVKHIKLVRRLQIIHNQASFSKLLGVIIENYGPEESRLVMKHFVWNFKNSI